MSLLSNYLNFTKFSRSWQIRKIKPKEFRLVFKEEFKIKDFNSVH